MENISITKTSSMHPYFRATPSGEYGPYVPYAVSFNLSAGGSGGFFSTNFNIGIAMSNNDMALVLGGDLSFGLDLTRPGFGYTGGIGFHDSYGGNKDVLAGMGGKDVGWSANALVGWVSYSQSALPNSEQISRDGVRSTMINVGPGLGGGTVSLSLINLVVMLKNGTVHGGFK